MKALMNAQRHNTLTALETELSSVRSFGFTRPNYQYDWTIKPECGLSAIKNRIMSSGSLYRRRILGVEAGT